MATNPTQQVDVEIKSSGLGKLKAQWADFAGELIEPMAILAAGGTKAQAAWAGMRGVFLTKVLGPIGMVTGAAMAFLMVTRRLVGEWRAVGLQSAKAVETLTLQFKPLLGSMELAKKRAREVFDFTVKSPFSFEDVAQGNKMLEALTKGALAGKEGMDIVGDAAAVAGASFQDTARYVGRLYDGLMSGRPVGEASMRMQELGLISGTTRNQIESMQAAGAAGSDVWKVVAKDLERTKGASEDLAESLAGLEETYNDTKQQLAAGFGKSFLEGEKAGIRATTAAMERLTPVGEYFGEMFGLVANTVAKVKAKVVDLATGFPGFTSVVKGAGLALTGLAGAIVLATGMLLGKFLMALVAAQVATQRLATTTLLASAAEGTQTVVTQGLTGAKLRLVAATAALRQGQIATAVAHLRASAAAVVASFSTNALATSQALLVGALRLTGKALMFVTAQIGSMAVALLATPAFWAAGAVVALAMALASMANTMRKAKEEMDAFVAAGRATIDNLEAQRRAIRTVNDLRAAEAAALTAVTEAHLAYQQAMQTSDRAGVGEAAKQLKAAQRKQEEIRGTDPATLDKTAPEREREAALREALRRAEEGARNFAAGAGPTAERDEAAADLARKRAAAERTAADMKAEDAVRRQQQGLQREADDRQPREAELLARQASLDPETQGGRIAIAGKELAESSAERERLAQEASRLALESGSELMVTKEKIKLYDEMEGSIQAAVDARKKLQELDLGADGWEEELEKAGVNYTAASTKSRMAQEAAGAAGVGEGSGFNRQAAGDAIAVMEERRTESLDPARVEEARQRAVTAEMALVNARIEGEKQVAGLRLHGYEREVTLLALEDQRLDAAKERGQIDRESYGRQKEELAERRALLDREAAERGEAIRGAFRIQQLDRQEQDARNGGDTEKAEALRLAREQEQDRQVRADAAREARELDLSPAQQAAFADSRVEEERAGRGAARRRDEEARGLSRDGSRANAGTAVAALQEQVLRRQGRTEEAKRVKEEAARKQDEVDRREARRRLIDQGMGEKEAGQLADQEVKTNQAARLMEQFGSGGATIVADSLAAVGGGGGVAGVDASERHLERMVKLLEQLKDNTKPSVDAGGW